MVRRYAPFLAVILLQVGLALVAPTTLPGDPTPLVHGVVGGGGVPSGIGDVPPGQAPEEGAKPGAGTLRPQGGGGAGTGELTQGGCESLSGIGGLGVGGLGCGLRADDPGGWPWSSPWRLTGDRSSCGGDGHLEETVTSWAVACTPKLSGGNGGATYQGVTAKKIVAIRYAAKYSDAEKALLSSQGLAMTDEQQQDALSVFGAFFNEHYNFYGRQIEWRLIRSNCDAGDTTCFRDEAKRIVAEHKPFLVFSEDGKVGFEPEFFDELSRRKVVNLGGRYLAASFNVERRPYHWDNNMDGTGVVRLVAEYWCRTMHGKRASLAGQASVRSMTRKLGIAVQETPGFVEQGHELAALVSGGMCGSSADDAVVLTHSSDTAQTSQQALPMAVRFKEEDVTTIVTLNSVIPIFLTRALDQQQYYPEHLIAGLYGMDHPLVGRLMSPTQWQNAFGLGHRPRDLPTGSTDDWKAWRDVGGPSEGPCTPCINTFEYMRQISAMIQWAGPVLTPLTFERGAMAAPQMNGWANDHPWPGWKCCNAAAVRWTFGRGDYTATEDVKEVWWDPEQESDVDGRPGHYFCVDGCRRRAAGEWKPGEPVPGKPRP